MKIIKLGVLVANKGCNANCSFCAGKQHRTNEPFDFNLFEKILNDNKDIQEISISGGGEPLLQPENITQTLYLIKKSDLPNLKSIKLYTNGILLNQSYIYLNSWKKWGLTHLYITVHNIDPKISQTTLQSKNLPPTMDQIRKIGDDINLQIPLFKEGINNVSALNEMKNKLNDYGLNNISSWVIRNNDDKRDSDLKKVFNFEEPVYNETKQTLFPNGELRFDWCN
jgi:uncharacterized Fe-S cluster-containing radical SAM superfamily enzyme